MKIMWKESLEIIGIILLLLLMLAGAVAVLVHNDNHDLWEHLMMDGE